MEVEEAEVDGEEGRHRDQEQGADIVGDPALRFDITSLPAMVTCHMSITCAPHMYPLHRGTMSHTIRVTLDGMMPLNMDDASPRDVQWSLPSTGGQDAVCSTSHICRECGNFYLLTDTSSLKVSLYF